jgi:pyruvate dehydrogenase E2 component (dihydrolipoamide acetyltransferase)
MSQTIPLPNLGEDIETAEIIKVHCKVGDDIAVGQPMLDVETGKATVPIESPVSGTLTSVDVSVGDEVIPGAPLFQIDTGNNDDTHVEAPKAAVPDPTTPPVPVPAPSAPPVVTSGAGETIAVDLPDLGEDIESAEVIEIMCKVGDKISAGQAILELETGKATVPIESPAQGTLISIDVSLGDALKPGAPLFRVEAKGNTPIASPASAAPNEQIAPAPAAGALAQPAPTQIQPAVAASSVEISAPAGPFIATNPSPAAPATRRMARELGVVLTDVKGSGPAGRITSVDVRTFVKQSLGASGSAAPSAPSLPDFARWGEVEYEPLRSLRKQTAQHVSLAWRTIPHVTQYDEAEITLLEALRKEQKPVFAEKNANLTATSFIVKALSEALQQYPQFNCSLDEANKRIVKKMYTHIGVAADTKRGLLVPVLRDVDKKSLLEVSIELSELSARAREGKLEMKELQGGTFTISNLGGIGGTAFTPIINHPEVAILGVARIQKRAGMEDGRVFPKLLLPLCLSYDHRVIDGADGARFLRLIAEMVEAPEQLL